MTTISILFLASLACGCFAAAWGSRAAWALIGSTALSSTLILVSAPFDMSLWLLIDVAVIGAIEAGKPKPSDHAIIGTFPFAWVLYHIQPTWWGDAITMIVALQFLLTVPWDRLGKLTFTEKRA